MVAYRRGQLAAGDCSPAAPTDPDVRVSSSGALGTAVNKTVQKLVDVVVTASGGPATWASASLPRRVLPAEPR